MKIDRKLAMAGLIGAIVLAGGSYLVVHNLSQAEAQSVVEGEASSHAAHGSPDSVELSDGQLKNVTLTTVVEHEFVQRRDAVGTIDFDQDTLAQVASPYAGRIIKVNVKAGDPVSKGATLFSIESPDLVQAESTLISAAGALELSNTVLARARELMANRGLAQKDFEQAVSDQQSAEAAYRAARDAVAIFGKTAEEMDMIIKARRVDPEMRVTSPVAGRVATRSGAPGDVVQPGGAAVVTVGDLTTKWMLASVPEAELPLIHLGQTVNVQVLAYPGKTFRGRVDNVSVAVDPVTHRGVVRSEFRDAQDQLKPQMFARFEIDLGEPVRAAAVPIAGVVREGDGTQTVWVTSDRRHFVARTVSIGTQQDGLQQVLDGLKVGEVVVGDGALFLSNARILGVQ